MAAIFDLQYTQTSESIPTSLSVLPDSENIGIAVVTVLIMFIRRDMSTSGFEAANLEFSHFRLGRAMFLIVLLDSWTSKT